MLPRLTLKFEKSANTEALTIEVEDFMEASAVYCTRRDESGEGHSTFPNALLTDPDSEDEYRISYNGKIWREKTWVPGAIPVYDPYGGVKPPC